MRRLIQFFANDALSFGILVLLTIFLLNNFSSAQELSRKVPRRNVNSTSFYRPSSQLFMYDFAINYGTTQGQQSLNLENTLSYSNPGFIKLKTYLNYKSGLSGSGNSDFSNFYSHFIFDDSYLSPSSVISTYGIMVLPFSKVSQDTEGMLAGGGLGTSFYALFSLIKLNAFTKINISLIKSFYKFETGKNNISNSSLLSNQSLNFGFSVQKILLDFQFKNTMVNDFNNKTNMSQNLKEALYWMFSRNTKIGFGHSNTAQILNSSQEEIPLEIYSNKESTLFFVFNHLF